MLKQFDYVFAIAMIFGFLDAFMIGMSPCHVVRMRTIFPT